MRYLINMNKPEWRNGRRARLKIWFPLGVWVQVPPPVPIFSVFHPEMLCFRVFFLPDKVCLRCVAVPEAQNPAGNKLFSGILCNIDLKRRSPSHIQDDPGIFQLFQFFIFLTPNGRESRYCSRRQYRQPMNKVAGKAKAAVTM